MKDIKNIGVRFYSDKDVANDTTKIIAGALLSMAGLSLLTGVSMRPVIFLLESGIILAIVWFGVTHGTYIEIKDKVIQGRGLYIKGRATKIQDIISLHRKASFGGLMFDIYMKVKEKDGKISERGLVSESSQKLENLQNLVGIILSINPNIKIDKDIFPKKSEKENV